MKLRTTKRSRTTSEVTMYKVAVAIFSVLLIVSSTLAQKAEVTVSLNEQFFDALLDGVFQAAGSPEFPLPESGGTAACSESIKVVREVGGVNTAVRFRNGQILAPMAFIGSYSPPFVGCVEFSGWAESVIDLEFDQASQRLVAKARVVNVNLNGSGGLGGNMIAKLIQSSIDKKINPIEVLRLEKLSFAVPLRGSGSLSMRAVGIRHEITNGNLLVRIAYEFTK
jgi:hypothetical protein